VAGRFGIGADRAINYECDSQGTRLNYEVLSKTVSAVRRSKSSVEMKDAIFACCAPIREDYERRHKGGKESEV
jgi:glucokinase